MPEASQGPGHGRGEVVDRVGGMGQGNGTRVWVGEIGQRCGTGKMGKMEWGEGLREMGKGLAWGDG